MLQALIGPITELAGGWLKGKADAQAAAANLKLVEAEAKSDHNEVCRYDRKRSGRRSWRRAP